MKLPIVKRMTDPSEPPITALFSFNVHFELAHTAVAPFTGTFLTVAVTLRDAFGTVMYVFVKSSANVAVDGKLKTV